MLMTDIQDKFVGDNRGMLVTTLVTKMGIAAQKSKIGHHHNS